MASAKPTVTVVTGDLTMRAGRGQFQLAKALIEHLPQPRIVVIGNHDIPLLNLVSRCTAPFHRYRSAITEELDPMLDVPGVRIQGLGSMPPWRWKSGRVTRDQSRRVVEVLGDTPPGTLRVLALHHPLWQDGAARLVGHGRLIAALAAARVDLVLAGHTHVPDARRRVLRGPDGDHPMLEVVAGTATSTRTRGTRRSWTLIRIDDGSMGVEHRYHDG